MLHRILTIALFLCLSGRAMGTAIMVYIQKNIVWIATDGLRGPAPYATVDKVHKAFGGLILKYGMSECKLGNQKQSIDSMLESEVTTSTTFTAFKSKVKSALIHLLNKCTDVRDLDQLVGIIFISSDIGSIRVQHLLLRAPIKEDLWKDLTIRSKPYYYPGTVWDIPPDWPSWIGDPRIGLRHLLQEAAHNHRCNIGPPFYVASVTLTNNKREPLKVISDPENYQYGWREIPIAPLQNCQ